MVNLFQATGSGLVVFLWAGLALNGCSPREAGGSDAVAPTVEDHDLITIPQYYSNYVEGRCCTVIAHAGGGVDGNSYTNSPEAIERNYALGTRLFELDFDRTSDGYWVAAHDWPNWKNRTQYDGDMPPNLDVFRSLKRKYPRVSWSITSEYSPMTFEWLVKFLEEHPDASIITDIKELDDFPEFVDFILANPAKNQFVFQAYRIHQVDSIKDRDPSVRVILTLYRLGFVDGLFEDLTNRRDKLFGVTVPMNWAFENDKMQKLRETGIPIYLHGAPSNINSRGLHADFATKGVSGFYLD